MTTDNSMQSITVAKTKYEEAQHMIHDLCAIRFPTECDVKCKHFSASFEEIVQGIILISLIEDGTVGQEEWAFLREFKSHASIMAHLGRELARRNITDLSLSEESIGKLSQEHKAELNHIICSTVAAAAEELYASFAATDYMISTVSYLDEIKKRITQIVISASIADGDTSGNDRALSERSAGLKAFYDIIEKQWKSYDVQSRSWFCEFN